MAKKGKDLKKLIKSAKTPKGFAILSTAALAVAVGAYAIATFAATTFRGQTNSVGKGTYNVCFYYKSADGGFQFHADPQYGPPKVQSVTIGGGKNGLVSVGGVKVDKTGYIKYKVVGAGYKSKYVTAKTSKCAKP